MAMFQKRHYDYLAEKIARITENADRETLLNYLGLWFSDDMENFKRGKWNEACVRRE